MGLFIPIVGGFLVVGLIVIFIFSVFALGAGFIIGGISYGITQSVETFKAVWIFVTAIIVILGLIKFISIF